MPDHTYTISQLASEFDVTPRAIRYYEDRGLLNPARAGQNRIYTFRDRGRLYLILRGKRVGFSLAEIGEMLDLYDLDDGQVGQASAVLEKVQRRIAILERQKQDLDQVIFELRNDSRKIEVFLQANSGPIKFEMPMPAGTDPEYLEHPEAAAE
ncbi:MAG TPA: MerR family DNA-binding transcriptional regulator [Sneathiellales bacterium]|nr:MerR family DNA-binding transcriptional regulator [Sneathiellales bacterium]